MKKDTLGIYVHVPYCLKKCRYCDFVSFEKVPDDEYFRELADSISNSAAILKLRSDALHISADPLVDTIFFGGGTPSLANARQLGMVLDAIRSCFRVLGDAEITIEMNPETVIPESVAELKALGFNRVSMGVQSLDDGVLSAMGRVHSADRAREAFRILRDAGFDNINLDLIFGAPCQNLKIWHQTLDEIFVLKPEHLSFYSLQLEEGTPFYDAYISGEIDLPSWDENREMYHCALQMIKMNGYHHYEVSNAALPGYECRHNLKYWNMQPYLGFGISAHSFIGGRRGELGFPLCEAYNCKNLSAYQINANYDCVLSIASSQPGRDNDCLAGLDSETTVDLKGDFIFTKLRLVDGFKLSDYRDMFGANFCDDFKEPVLSLIEDGFIAINDGRLALTLKGLDNTNPVIARLLDTI